MKNNILSAYIHVPFCKQKCFYCDFNSYAEKDDLICEYFNMLKKEINLTFEYLNRHQSETLLSSIYFGGGTPGMVDSIYLTEILQVLKEKYGIVQNSEVTVECNPESTTLEKLLDYKKSGVNRISIGLQSESNKILKKIGRVHTYEQFNSTYNMALNSGYENINVDLICGLIFQKKEDFLSSIENLIKRDVKHISLYSLSIEENTPMKKIFKMEFNDFPNEEQERLMYWGAKNLLEKNGYNQYEISNFAKPDYEGKHNTFCWEGNWYFGFGAGAHSFFNNKRFSNFKSISHYIENIKTANKFEDIKREEEIELSDKDLEQEYFLLGLRLLKGVTKEEFESKFNCGFSGYKKILDQLINDNYLVYKNGAYSLSRKGLDFANKVFVEFV